ncbi:MAG TPA: proteasome accessory factor PafA2 family protein [Candidatus Saccharimonadales bacterium]|nr:proteasome accessory factor PafA2 family protein [Candidatus Saccharimonadales bacterium]
MGRQEHSVYPALFGVEEELQIEKTYTGQRAITVSADELQDALERYQQAVANGSPALIYDEPYRHVYRRHSSAGDKSYIDCLNAERATAECHSVREAIVRSRGVEQFAAGIAQSLIEADPAIATVIHRRRAGHFSDVIGTQDNIYIPTNPTNSSLHHDRILNLLIGIAVTRPYMSGAGEYKEGQFFFAQKFAKLGQFWATHKQKVQPVERGGERYEIRENDINICDAAAMMRLGSAPLGGALAQTTLFGKLERDLENILQGQDTDVDWIDRFNIPVLRPDGSFDTGKNANLLQAAEFYLRIADLFASREMQKQAGEQPAELIGIAEQIHDYTTTMAAVIRNDLPIESLVSKSDWAAKHTNGGPSLDYDTITYRNTGKATTTKETRGLGFKLRDTGVFAGDIPQAEVDVAYFTRPAGTRAALRGRVIEEYVAADAAWGCLTLFQKNPDGTTKPVIFYMPDPLQPEPAAEQARILQTVSRRPARLS